ncbi:MAG TPA: deoxyguanosinetriphosphate triphosphohydrolase [Chthonomonadaceae bacterium]|nr:deoxyguanosinetriphosphate triphosphohydrolase [Chthonomonadaceae bacterium]
MPTPRERQEQWERDFLAPWAAKAAESRGRERPETPDPVRTAFQRDRDRILHSKAFRRLKHKTQVFIDPEEDHYRTRLTHTLEVAQIARTIARALRLNEDLTEAIALAHDLGHPPFGHAGEEALDAAYREFVPRAGFRHYEQSLRVVELLERGTGEGASGPGLNLTWEVRDGIARHSKGRKDLTDTSTERASTLEGKAVRIADRVAYINHDIDDALRAGVLKPADLPRELMESLGHTHSERIASMVIDIVQTSDDRPIVEMSPAVAAATDTLKEFLFERVYWNAATGNQDLRKAQHVLHALFHIYMEQPERMTGDPSLRDLPTEERAQRVCDYIAGMTDRYAVSCFVRHFVPRGAR